MGDQGLADDADALADLGTTTRGEGLVEDVLVDALALLTAVLPRPGDAEPALLAHLLHQRSALGCVDNLGHVLPGEVEYLGIVVGVEEGFNLGPEGLLLRGEVEVHGRPL